MGEAREWQLRGAATQPRQQGGAAACKPTRMQKG